MKFRASSGVKRAREFVRKIVVDAPPECLEIGIEDETIAGRFAVLEITAIPLIGPRLPLAPAADPSDRNLEISASSAITSAEQAGLRAVARQSRERRSRRRCRRAAAQRLTIAGQFRRIRLDSKLWNGEPDPRLDNTWPVIGIATEPQPLHFLVSD